MELDGAAEQGHGKIVFTTEDTEDTEEFLLGSVLLCVLCVLRG